jgi:hypothetical protein
MQYHLVFYQCVWLIKKLQYHIVNLIGEEIVSASFNSRKDAFVFARIVGMDLVLNEMK